MGLAEQQAALARLYTSGAFRAAFRADPAAAGAVCGLSADEARALAALPADGLDYFARSLVHKRLGEVAKLLPATHAALGARFAALFWRFAERHVPDGIHKHHADALAFVRWLAHAPPADADVPAWTLDLARYEAAWLAMADPIRRALSLRLAHAPRALLAASRDATAAPPPRRPTLAVWVRPTGRSRLRHRALSLG